MRAYKSWMEQEREDTWHTDEQAEALREEALQEWKLWPQSDRFSNSEENMMYAFAELGMEKEFFEVGEAIIGRYPDPDDDWYVAETVYMRYGHYFLHVKKQKEALHWYMKALENRLPYPPIIWKEIAACYVELEDWPNADFWIEKW